MSPRLNEARYRAALGDTLAWRYSSAAELGRLRTPRDAARLTRDALYFALMRRRRARVILKDPLAVFSAAWLARRFDARVVVVIRHPASFVASMRAAGYSVNFAVFAGQPALVADRLDPYADRLAALAATRSDSIEALTLLWTLIHHHIARLRDEHPDWDFVRHEDLSLDPVAGFETLFARLGLDFSAAVRRRLGRFTTDPGPLGRLSLFGNKRRTIGNSRATVSRFRTAAHPGGDRPHPRRHRAGLASISTPPATGSVPHAERPPPTPAPPAPSRRRGRPPPGS